MMAWATEHLLGRSRIDDRASRTLADWDDASTVAGTNVVYAATITSETLAAEFPARPFLGVSGDARIAISQAIVGHLESPATLTAIAEPCAQWIRSG